MADMLLDVYDLLTGRGLKPFSIQLLSRVSELNDQIAIQILRLDLTSFLLPKPDQRSFVNAHNDFQRRTRQQTGGGSPRPALNSGFKPRSFSENRP